MKKCSRAIITKAASCKITSRKSWRSPPASETVVSPRGCKTWLLDLHMAPGFELATSEAMGPRGGPRTRGHACQPHHVRLGPPHDSHREGSGLPHWAHFHCHSSQIWAPHLHPAAHVPGLTPTTPLPHPYLHPLSLRSFPVPPCTTTPTIPLPHFFSLPHTLKMMGFVSGVAAVSSVRRAPAAVCTRSSFAGAAVVAAPVARATMQMSNIQETIQSEIAKAKEASEKFGKTSKEAAAAWYVVSLLVRPFCPSLILFLWFSHARCQAWLARWYGWASSHFCLPCCPVLTTDILHSRFCSRFLLILPLS